jgi:hypothetical protein
VLPPDQGAQACPSDRYVQSCKSVTILAQITPSHLGFHIRTFECQLCSDIHQIVTEWEDPMQSRKTAGWLRDELRAPT